MRRVWIILLFISCQSAVFSQGTYDESREDQITTAGRKNSALAMSQPYVVMISIDGFRYDYAEKYQAKNILKMMKDGASANRMIPSFPSKTFPNHYTLVTGLSPGHHGIVANEFYSRSRNEWYAIRNRGSVQNGAWYGGKPLWVLAEEQGMLSASYFWVGSEAEIGGIRPTYYYKYNGKTPNSYRYRQALEWLSLDPTIRPHFIAVYFSIVDDAGHNFGPDAPETRRAVQEMDSLFGVFQDQLTQFPYDITTVVVSDHGMSAISEGVVLSDVTNLQDSKVSWSFPPMIYQPDEVVREEIYQELLKDERIQVWKKENLPAYFDYRNDDRVGDLVLLTKAPIVILKDSEEVVGGTHGFDPFQSEEMGAIFGAVGPRIKPGFKIETLENIHIYPFVSQLLGLKIDTEIDGDPVYLSPAILKGDDK